MAERDTGPGVLEWSPKSEDIEGVNLMGMERLQDVTEFVEQAVQKAPLIDEYLRKAARFAGSSFQGVVAELGAGTGVLSARLAEMPSVKLVYAVEYSRNLVERAMPQTFQRLGVNVATVVRVVGDFNQLRFEDESLDHVLEFGAFHHSHDICRTVAETYRVLRRGGWFVGIDRVHSDSTTDVEIEELLLRQLRDTQKVRYGFHPGSSVTRYDWGEHEYREREWRSFFEEAGFDVWILRVLSPSGPRSRLRAALLRLLEPVLLLRRITALPFPGLRGMSSALIVASKG